MNTIQSSPYLAFLRSLLIFSAILGIIAGGLYFLVPSRYITPALPFIFAFFIGIALVSYYFLLRSSAKSFVTFLNRFMLITVLKLFLFIGVIFLYMFLNKPDAARFAISFLILYFLYMVFEVVQLLFYLKPGKNDQRREDLGPTSDL